MLLLVFAALNLLTWSSTVLAQDCFFRLTSDNYVLSQLKSGQIIGIQKTNAPADQQGIMFRLEQRGLYDALGRGCWWATPSTVLVCDIPPPGVSDPLFALEQQGHLVFSSSQSQFWACPIEVEWGGPGQMLSGKSYYLELPEWMQGGADGRVCKEVEIDAGELEGGTCGAGSPDSSTSSSSSVMSSSSASASTSSASSSSSTSSSSSSQEQEATGAPSSGQSSSMEGSEETIIWTVTFDDVTMTFTVADETSSSSGWQDRRGHHIHTSDAHDGDCDSYQFYCCQ